MLPEEIDMIHLLAGMTAIETYAHNDINAFAVSTVNMNM